MNYVYKSKKQLNKWWYLALRCSGWSSLSRLLSTAIRTSSKLWTPWWSERGGGGWILVVDFLMSLSLAVIRRSLGVEAISVAGDAALRSTFFFLSSDGDTLSGFSSLQRWFNRNGGWRPASLLVVDNVVGVGVAVPLGVPRLLSWPLRRHTLHRQNVCLRDKNRIINPLFIQSIYDQLTSTSWLVHDSNKYLKWIACGQIDQHRKGLNRPTATS